MAATPLSAEEEIIVWQLAVVLATGACVFETCRLSHDKSYSDAEVEETFNSQQPNPIQDSNLFMDLLALEHSLWWYKYRQCILADIAREWFVKLCLPLMCGGCF